MRFAVKGGIGDFLQCLPFMLAHPEHEYLVASHYDRATEFFAAVGLRVEDLSLSSLSGVPVTSRMIGADDCPRELFFGRNPFKPVARVFSGKRPVVGIHLGGSAYSVGVENRFGFPSKVLPWTVLDKLLESRQYDFLLFGSRAEIAKIDDDRCVYLEECQHLEVVCDEDATVSLSHVAECSALIGSDSAFKTMSSMLRIPTVVWVGDYRDDHRDYRFINPYVKASVMGVYRYFDLTKPGQVARGIAVTNMVLDRFGRKLATLESCS